MSGPSEEAIRVKAYEIWVAEGRPHGRDHAHWLMAREQLTLEIAKPKPTRAVKTDVVAAANSVAKETKPRKAKVKAADEAKPAAEPKAKPARAAKAAAKPAANGEAKAKAAAEPSAAKPAPKRASKPKADAKPSAAEEAAEPTKSTA